MLTSLVITIFSVLISSTMLKKFSILVIHSWQLIPIKMPLFFINIREILRFIRIDMTNVKKISAVKRIALIADPNQEKALIQWAGEHYKQLIDHKLIVIGPTSHALKKNINTHLTKTDRFKFQFQINKLKPALLGGYIELGAMIAEKKIDLLILLWDPTQPQDHDVQALLRIAVLYNIPTANNFSTANSLLASSITDNHRKTYSSYIDTKQRLNLAKNIA